MRTSHKAKDAAAEKQSYVCDTFTGESARHRRVYEPTQAGRAAHATWLRTPAEVSTVSRDLGLHLMHFVMMERASSREEVLSFLAGEARRESARGATRHRSGRRAPR